MESASYVFGNTTVVVQSGMNGITVSEVKTSMRTIDVDEAIINFGFEWDDIPPTREEFVRFLKKQPTVDAVPVVRCRECKHHRDKNEQERQYLVEDILICTSPDATDDCWNAVWPDHFCSYGERKEGAD